MFQVCTWLSVAKLAAFPAKPRAGWLKPLESFHETSPLLPNTKSCFSLISRYFNPLRPNLNFARVHPVPILIQNGGVENCRDR